EFIFDDPLEVNNRSVIHHKDFNRYNNSPDNLLYMGFFDHFHYHGDNAEKTLPRSKEFYEKRSQNEKWKINISIARSKQKNRFHKTWRISTPEGNQIISENLNEFCRNNDLNRCNIKGKFGSRGYHAEILKNHKVTSIEWLSDKIDVGCLTVDLNETYHSNHTYLVDAGVFLKNTMTEDYWLPKRSDGQGTRVEPIPGGQNLGNIDDIIYFQKQLYNSLHVPIERLQSDSSPFDIGNAGEISKAEIKFNKFINRLKQQFSLLFREVLKRHLILQGLMTLEEFELIEKDIEYVFARDNHWAELKDHQILGARIQTYMGMLESGIIGTYVSHDWTRRNIFQQTEDDIEEQTELIIQELQNPLYNRPTPEQEQAEQSADTEQNNQEQQQAHDDKQAQQQQEQPPEPDPNEKTYKLQRAQNVIKAI